MTIDKAIEIQNELLLEKQVGVPDKLRAAIKLGIEALAELVRLRKVIPILKDTLLPSETPIIDNNRSLHHIKEVLEG